MAFGREVFNEATSYENSDESYHIWVVDLLAGFKPYSWWLLEAGIEHFVYEDGYKRKLPTAAIENRYQLKSTIDYGRWKQNLSLNIIGSRDISKYGLYDDQYVKVIEQSAGVIDTNQSELKNQKSPTYLTVDLGVSYKFSKKINLSLQVDNVFDYTQTGSGDSPSAWHWHFNHAEFDSLHNWGPNTGRQFHLSISGEF